MYFFHTILGFTKLEFNLATTSEKPVISTRIDSIPFEYDSIDGYNVKGFRRNVFSAFEWNKPLGCRMIKDLKTNHHNRKIKS